MRFGGIQKTSLIDYPGQVSCVVFTLGCNFHCPYCHNPDIVKEKPVQGLFKEEDLYAFLKKRKGLLDGVVLSGGEPTLQKDLARVCLQIKTLGFSVKLDTNGGQPQVLKTILEAGLADYVAMDIKTDPHHYAPAISYKDPAHDILESIRLIMGSSISYEFRTTCVKPFVDEPIMEQITQIIEGARLYALQHFQPNHLLTPEFFKDTTPGFDPEGMGRLLAVAAPNVQSCIIR